MENFNNPLSNLQIKPAKKEKSSEDIEYLITQLKS